MELPASSFRWPFRPDGLKSIRIDIDPVEMRRLTSDVAVVSDAKAGTRELLRRGAARPATARPLAAAPRSARLRPAALQEISEGAAADGVSEHPARGAAARTLSSPMNCRRSASPPGTAFRSTSRAPSSPRAIKARWARVFRPRSAPRSPIPTGRWSPYRRWRLHVRGGGARHRRAVQHRRGDTGVQQQCLRQRAARPAHALRRPRGRVRPRQSGFRQARGNPRRGGKPRDFARSFSRCAGKGARRGRALPDRDRSPERAASETTPWTFIHPAKP